MRYLTIIWDGSEFCRNEDFCSSRLDAQIESSKLLLTAHSLKFGEDSRAAIVSVPAVSSVLQQFVDPSEIRVEDVGLSLQECTQKFSLASSLGLAAMIRPKTDSQDAHVVAFVCSPITSNMLELFARCSPLCLRGGVLDIVSFGECESNRDVLSQLQTKLGRNCVVHHTNAGEFPTLAHSILEKDVVRIRGLSVSPHGLWKSAFLQSSIGTETPPHGPRILLSSPAKRASNIPTPKACRGENSRPARIMYGVSVQGMPLNFGGNGRLDNALMTAAYLIAARGASRGSDKGPLRSQTYYEDLLESPEEILVQFKAGRCFLVDGQMVSEKRSGMVYVHRTDDGVHVLWQDRNTKVVESDIPVKVNFKDVFAQISAPSETPVVSCVDMTSKRQAYFWLQEPLEETERILDEILSVRARSSSYVSSEGDNAAGLPRLLDLLMPSGVRALEKSPSRKRSDSLPDTEHFTSKKRLDFAFDDKYPSSGDEEETIEQLSSSVPSTSSYGEFTNLSVASSSPVLDALPPPATTVSEADLKSLEDLDIGNDIGTQFPRTPPVSPARPPSSQLIRTALRDRGSTTLRRELEAGDSKSEEKKETGEKPLPEVQVVTPANLSDVLRRYENPDSTRSPPPK